MPEADFNKNALFIDRTDLHATAPDARSGRFLIFVQL
jgi:hypothetical protein